jgi:serine/threonine protein kinase
MRPADLPTEADDGWLAGVDRVELRGRLGRYELRDVAGVGGMAMVFEARDPALDRTVAIKVLRSTSRGTAGEAVLRREGQTMARINHPNVVRVYDVGLAHGHTFVAMEFVRGGTLTTWLDRPRTTAEILAAFGHAGRGLAATHAAGLVHRDFKPANVLVGDDGRVLITDFGIARSPEADDATTALDPTQRLLVLMQTQTSTGDVAGTPAYMAPEQQRGDPVDARADQFSFCVALWRALFGILPVPGETATELAASIAAGVARARSATPLSPEVRAALERGLRIARAERFASMTELLAALG